MKADCMKPVAGLEPASLDYESSALPLSYTGGRRIYDA